MVAYQSQCDGPLVLEAARSIGVDETGKEFERALKKIIPAKSQTKTAK